MTETTRTKGVSRRTLLKGTAGLAGLAAGSGAITGFPYVKSADAKVLRYLGTAVNEGDDIAKQCLKDTGIKIEYITATTDDVTKRVMTQPNSFDVLDTEYFSLKKIVPSGNILALDARKIKQFDNITPVFTKGETPGGKKIGGQGTAPWKVLYLEGKDSKKFATSATEFVTLIPTVYNADTLGIRPDLIKRPISSWSELLNPEFKGKASILNIPSIGIMDAAMVVEASGKYKYADKGNMTKEEIDLTMKVMTEAKKAGQFRAFWKDFNESVNLMASGETVIQSILTNELVYGMPNIFCGILVVALVILYFMNKRIDVKYRRAAGIVLGLYLLTFYIHAFTLVMHGGTHTNWFPYRYSYVFSFLLICLAVEEFRYIPVLTVEETKKGGAVLLIAALIVFGTSYEFITGGMVVLDFLLLLCILALENRY